MWTTLAVWYGTRNVATQKINKQTTHLQWKLYKIMEESLVTQADICRVQPDNPNSLTVPVESDLCSLASERRLLSSLRRKRIPLLRLNMIVDGQSYDLWPQECVLCFRFVRAVRKLCWQRSSYSPVTASVLLAFYSKVYHIFDPISITYINVVQIKTLKSLWYLIK